MKNYIQLITWHENKASQYNNKCRTCSVGIPARQGLLLPFQIEFDEVVTDPILNMIDCCNVDNVFDTPTDAVTIYKETVQYIWTVESTGTNDLEITYDVIIDGILTTVGSEFVTAGETVEIKAITLSIVPGGVGTVTQGVMCEPVQHGVNWSILELSKETKVSGLPKCYYYRLKYKDSEGSDKILYSDRIYQICSIRCTLMRLRWGNSCDINGAYYAGGFEQYLYLDNDFYDPEPIRFESLKSNEETGVTIKSFSRLTMEESFSFLATGAMVGALLAISDHDTVHLDDIDNTKTYELTNVSIDLGGSKSDCERLVTVSFVCPDREIESGACCKKTNTIIQAC